MEALMFLFVIVVIPVAAIILLLYVAGRIYKSATGLSTSKRAIKERLREQMRAAQAEKDAAQELIREYETKGRI